LVAWVARGRRFGVVVWVGHIREPDPDVIVPLRSNWIPMGNNAN
jgi:hypothetical protein